jgi:DNA modification methylase
MKEISQNIILGDCAEALKNLEDNSIDLIFTSPPYADQRKTTYGGISADKYVEWFLPISNELLRVLNPKGTFVLNIKEKVSNGERHTYVMEMIIAMQLLLNLLVIKRMKKMKLFLSLTPKSLIGLRLNLEKIFVMKAVKLIGKN